MKYTTPSFLHRRLSVILALVMVLALLPVTSASAQDGTAAKSIEALALRTHLQNFRTGSYTFWVGGNLGNERNAPMRGAPIGEDLGAYAMPGLVEGTPGFTYQDLERPVLLNFWASWCPPCRIEFPHLSQVALAPEDHNFDVVFVNMSDKKEDALAFLETQPEGLHTVLDETNRLSRRTSINSIPTSLLVDADNKVLIAHVGVVTPTVTDFLDAVAAQPGVGMFVAADHEDVKPTAELLPVDAANATPIEAGERVLDTLTPENFQAVYRFDGHSGDQVTIELQADSSELDPYLVLMDAEGTRLAENDDADLGQDAAITQTLPADGTYLIVATRFLEAEGFSAGDYSLTLSIGGTESEELAEGFIGYGSTVQGRVSGNNPREFYSFEGTAGDVVALRVEHEPGDVALRIEIKAPDMSRLVVSDESVNGVASLEAVELPADGNYLITVSRPRSRDTENLLYTLTLEAASSATVRSES